jgi:hypothetical protein
MLRNFIKQYRLQIDPGTRPPVFRNEVSMSLHEQSTTKWVLRLPHHRRWTFWSSGILRCLAGSLTYWQRCTAYHPWRRESSKHYKVFKWKKVLQLVCQLGSVMETVVLLASSRYMQCLSRVCFDTLVWFSYPLITQYSECSVSMLFLKTNYSTCLPKFIIPSSRNLWRN